MRVSCLFVSSVRVRVVGCFLVGPQVMARSRANTSSLSTGRLLRSSSAITSLSCPCRQSVTLELSQEFGGGCLLQACFREVHKPSVFSNFRSNGERHREELNLLIALEKSATIEGPNCVNKSASVQRILKPKGK